MRVWKLYSLFLFLIVQVLVLVFGNLDVTIEYVITALLLLQCYILVRIAQRSIFNYDVALQGLNKVANTDCLSSKEFWDLGCEEVARALDQMIATKRVVFEAIDSIDNHRKVEDLLATCRPSRLREVLLATSDRVEEERQDFLSQRVELLAQNKDLELAQKVLEDRSRELHELAQHKSQFLANMSHEFRTPLNAIINFSEFALQDSDLKTIQESVRSIHASSLHLLGVVNDVLDLSSIESGKLTLAKEDFDPRVQIDLALKIARIQAEQKGVEIMDDIDPDLPRLASGDGRRFSQVLINLLGNAVKFNRNDGAIIFSLVIEARTIQSVVLSLSITDTGVGIPEHLHEKIFEPFIQGDASLKRSYEGTGLGLAITAHLIEMMKGEIKLRSRPGVGTQFNLTLPLSTQLESYDIDTDSDTADVNSMVEGQSLRILVAEDNRVNQMIIKKILQAHGQSVTIANNGEEAVSLFQDEDFDLVLMDIQMPKMDGLEACRRIINYEQENQLNHIPIIAVTAHALQEERKRYMSSGMDGYVTKPLDKSLLLKEINRCLLGVTAEESK